MLKSAAIGDVRDGFGGRKGLSDLEANEYPARWISVFWIRRMVFGLQNEI